eukprot:CAMPEP_0171959730 /NCGR_PEP_ID=MMETSP0993-20121228/150340_1 /TAXON_ID=483369 /ORGANISM="non described non described, Strain CCMP2098" /LENGTH=52 /DNA_ID=CAMNT_0012607317 /DNA_START=212 /DNA_END=370 /DNA_ORIENTATION=+
MFAVLGTVHGAASSRVAPKTTPAAASSPPAVAMPPLLVLPLLLAANVGKAKV